MIKVITANLLAEKPYRKYGKMAFVDFSKRTESLYFQISKLMPDVMLLQEVDTLWREYLELHILELGYAVHFGDSWSSGLAILWKLDSMMLANVEPINFKEPGILNLELIKVKSNKPIRFVNLHAPWGNAESFDTFYSSVISDIGPILIAGDLNTNYPEINSNFFYFFNKLFNYQKGYREFTDFIKFTARNVKTNKPEKLDYIIGLNISGYETKIYPENLSLLIPHYPGGDFFLENENNHFSDHAIVFSNITF